MLFPDGIAVTCDHDWRDAVIGLDEIDERDRVVAPAFRPRAETPVVHQARRSLIALPDAGAVATLRVRDADCSQRPDGTFAAILEHTALAHLAYFGMSYGAAAVSAAQVDERAGVATNLDGTH